MDIATALIAIGCATAIILYATWLLGERLRAPQGKARSFGQWLKHLFEAVWGL
jgi:hypothetical protein